MRSSPSVWVVGNGQLGQMLRQAGEPIGVTVHTVGFSDPLPVTLPKDAVITAEIEQWPNTPLIHQLTTHPGFIQRAAFSQLSDRLAQKILLTQLKLATPAWAPLGSPKEWCSFFTQLGTTLLVKKRCGGYDGKGQWKIQFGEQHIIPEKWYGHAIVEQHVPFDREISLIGTRNIHGLCRFFPLTYNLHQQGILRSSVALPKPQQPLQEQAEGMLHCIMEHLNYIGIMAMECFVVRDQLLINELAPRVHNSGHWTQEGASISQFELHLRTLLSWPLPKIEIPAPTIMINLIGIDFDISWLATTLVKLHWYNKEVKKGRKVGHINITHADTKRLQHAMQALRPLMDATTQSAIDWACQFVPIT